MSKLSRSKLAAYVVARANGFCEYCQTAYRMTGQSMHIEHIIPSAGDDVSNLCLSCPNCNLSKWTATSAPDPVTGSVAPLYHPRTQRWSEHFQWDTIGIEVVGLTPTVRATVARLRMNDEGIVAARRIWLLTGLHPPDENNAAMTETRYLHLVRHDCPLPPGTSVVVYCRDSGGEEQDRSIAQQVAAAQEYCTHSPACTGTYLC